MDHLEWEISQEGHAASLWINNLIRIRIFPSSYHGGAILYDYEVCNATMRTIFTGCNRANLQLAQGEALRAAWDCLVTALGDLSGLGGGA